MSFEFVLLLLCVGCCSGLVAGLLGVGGGIIIVPALMMLFSVLTYAPEAQMQMAVGTSLSIICLTSLSSIWAHHKKGMVDLSFVKGWALPIIVGGFIGSYIAHQISSEALQLFFGVVLFCLSIKMFLPAPSGAAERSVPMLVDKGVGFLVGGISALAGIGGGSLTVPYLSFRGWDMKRAVGSSAAIGLLISLPATIGFIGVDLYQSDHSYEGAIGSVNYLGALCIAPTAVLCAPLGAKIAHQINSGRLKKIFAFFLIVVSIKMLWTVLS